MEEFLDSLEKDIEEVKELSERLLASTEEYMIINGAIPEQLQSSNEEIITRFQRVLDGKQRLLDGALFDSKLVTVALTERLLRMGANVHTNRGGMPVLHSVQMDGRYEIVGTLLSHGADVNQRDHNGNTPLHWACSGVSGRRCLENVRTLLRAGADPTARSDFKWLGGRRARTPIEWLNGGHEEIAKLLRQVDRRRQWGFIDMLRRRAGTEAGSVVEGPEEKRRSPRLPTAIGLGAIKYLQIDAPDHIFDMVMRFL